MHSRGMIHGDLKGVRTRKPQLCLPLTILIFQLNILIDRTGRARLADFGLLTIVPDSSSVTSRGQGGTTRWMSPELLDPEIQDHRQTIYSDCYALGMVIYEVLSEKIPFYQFLNLVISWKVLKGDRPERPQGAEGAWFTDDVWEVLGRCWMSQPRDRPSVKDVLQCLEEVSRSWTPLSAPPTVGLPIPDLSDLISVGSTDTGGTPPKSPMGGNNDHETSASIFLMKVANWDGRSQEIHEALTAAFETKDYLECLKDLRARQIEPQLYINNLDKVSPYSIPKRLARFMTIGNRSLTAFRPTPNSGDDAYER